LTCITGKDDLFHKIENTVQYICVFCLWIFRFKSGMRRKNMLKAKRIWK
jgi:hypothetical protein